MEVRVAGVRKEFARFPALHNVSLDIRSGELIALLGPSGSGKTTLLRLIAGLETPTEGTIFFGDEDASQKSVQERNVGFVFQHYALFRHMTVADNIGFGLKVRPSATRPSSDAIRSRALELLDLVQLQGLEKRYPAQLSGGQRQRVALARAMAIEPKVLLLDEPFGALDALVRKELRRWLREIHDKTGHTTVFVTHDQDEALELADRVVVMSQGRIEQVGTPDEVYDNPNSPGVYGFIGESSTLPVRVEKGEIWLVDRNIGLTVEGGVADGDAQLFFRPHDVELLDGCGGCIAGTVVASRRSGGKRRVELEVGGARERVEIEIPAEHPAAEKSRIAFRPRYWKVFPAGDTGSGAGS
ncbi:MULTISPECIES: sulfate/molybdate ABC transporter ATP-binding protein [Brucella/Ochrobactrum group]|jgi:sulfate transport system ATP-binding protein|uniref:Sulfate/molybdate ABC transporter ATP-binding protein n=1 Tax=Brucella pseudintermedia TaxID=370111 RepID=A0ABY5U919_9HYPH|nr:MULTISPECIES: sulfate/molybdate ABC transporter ATP-binding protein [Brucella/Ochrobactrum group]KAB2682708.1 sulfate/molybdate ABC transporter ATP-binding protein [Brucella pseudintermedia]MCO7725178.1 sulfate/molybdate ABC transporter ATP-binding protein [Brucella intermedia]NKE76042.1 sulfate/molybdate ABC transporter ATP-binding protein [Ochrobactrum sp. MC-1LL]TWH00387.1 sulfate transport system ATP-binding protein [Ochrobactrum sp. J50]UWL59830.1 sulfate/molybdate ABC transporter ATP-